VCLQWLSVSPVLFQRRLRPTIIMGATTAILIAAITIGIIIGGTIIGTGDG